jgi:exopolyphosphatase/guanosine-5'-triphosphate,3'-diphosphate pyrophosphatase
MTDPIAVIEVGSSAIRMVIAEVGPKLVIRVLENLQKPVSFGKDVFTSGRLSHASIRMGIEILDNFEAVMESYGVKRVQAIATSAVRQQGQLHRPDFCPHGYRRRSHRRG